jgi:hypothetical protein
MLGKLLSLPVRILNIGPRAVEKLVDGMCGSDTPKSERILSKPLEVLAEAIEEIDE